MSSGSKALAKLMKEKGLKKVRFYCQFCRKQCRDQNGYDNHMGSDGHRRRAQEFEEDKRGTESRFSREFEEAFIQCLRQRYQVRVLANRVYNEYVQDRHHVHMNATRWKTLAAFVRHLADTGRCLVEDTDEGAYITYRPDTDPTSSLVAQLRKQAKRSRQDAHAESTDLASMQQQAKRAASIPAAPLPLLAPDTDYLLGTAFLPFSTDQPFDLQSTQSFDLQSTQSSNLQSTQSFDLQSTQSTQSSSSDLQSNQSSDLQSNQIVEPFSSTNVYTSWTFSAPSMDQQPEGLLPLAFTLPALSVAADSTALGPSVFSSPPR